MMKTAVVMGNWWLAASSGQHARSCIRLMQSFFWEISQVTQPCYSPDLVPCDFWLFLKLKSPLKGKRFQTIDENSGKYDRAADGNKSKEFCSVLNSGTDTGRTVWGPNVPALKGTEMSLSYIQCFLYPVSSSVNVSVFHSTWLDTFWTDLVDWIMMLMTKSNTKVALFILCSEEVFIFIISFYVESI